MATVDLIAQTVMNASATLMNDTARVTYTYPVQVPWLNLALQELQEWFQFYSVPVTEISSAVIDMLSASNTEIVFNGVGVPSLPSDLIEPRQLWERNHGIDPFIPMTRKDYLPHNLEGIQDNQFIYWVWQNSRISFLQSTQRNDIKIDYTRQIFTPVVDQSSQINCINAQTYLQFQTAGLMAEFIERNLTSANGHYAHALQALDRALGITIKNKQTIATRRRPFRANYKRRGWVT